MGRMKFHVDKLYRCANGKTVVHKSPYGDDAFVGGEVGGDSFGQQCFVYESDGRPRGTGFAGWTIIEEIKSDGPREIIDPEYDVSRLGPKKAHENVTDRLARIEEQVKNLIDRIAAVDRIQAEGRRALSARLAKSDEEAALNLVATDARLDRLSGIITEQDKRLDTAFQCIDAINERLDRCATMGDLRQVHSRLNRITTKLNIEPTNEEIAAAGPTPIERKHLYAGGWLNIYVDDVTGKLSVGVLQDDRATCDKRDVTSHRFRRIACIPLTRIREGDGL